jgi:uracil-DNA glycosylase
MTTLPPDWAEVLAAELAAPWFAELSAFVAAERARGVVHPPEDQVYSAFELTPLSRVKVVVMGQDPYHGPGQAHGLALSVPPGVPPPPSLANMLKEARDDVGLELPCDGCLVPWARQGVLLLNAVLTVRAGEAGSHQGKGWERFTDAAVRAVAARERPSVFVLWGNQARKKARLVDAARHRVIEGVHPSPLSAWGGFFGSRPYSRINAALVELGHEPIDWRLPPPSERR